MDDGERQVAGTMASALEEKVALFRRLFRGGKDVFARKAIAVLTGGGGG